MTNGLVAIAKKIDRPGHQTGKHLGVRLANALGHQLAHNDGEVGNQHHHQPRRGIAGIRKRHANRLQPCGQWADQGGLAHNTVKNTNRRDADLDGEQEARGIFTQLHRRSGTAIALINQLLQTCFASCHQSDL